jgi:hypothetical protein
LQQFWRQNDGYQINSRKTNALKDGGWNDLKEAGETNWTSTENLKFSPTFQGFLNFFAANPSYFANSPGNHCPHPFQPSCARSSASLSRFMRKGQWKRNAQKFH